MLFREIVAVYCENYTEHTNTLCGQKTQSTPHRKHIVTRYLRSQPIQRFIARQQLRKHATILETLLGNSPRVTMEVQLEAVFSVWSAPRLYHAIDSSAENANKGKDKYNK
jgi:hypothetical protein